jgi:tRNA nucleotidyltransferase (CCA-adding enzyme)
MTKNTELLKQLAQHVADLGGRLFLVGGSVRDELLGLEPKDLDCEVFGLEADVLELLLDTFADLNKLSFSKVGKSFQVFKVGEFDVSLPRRDRKVGAGHTGFEVEADPNMSTREAASRRDFTVNALMKDLTTGRVHDHFGGLKDLETKTLRAVNDNAFEEDPLRVLRGLQFAARFDFGVDFETLRLMSTPDLSELPSERLFVEFEKLFLKSERPSAGLGHVPFMQNMMKAFPMVKELVGNPEDPVHHGEPDTFTHTLLAVDVAAGLVKDLPKAEALTVMLAVFCHDFGKPDTTECHSDGRCSAHGHSKAGLKPTTDFLDMLGVFTVDGFDVRKQVLALVENHLFPSALMTQLRKGEKVDHQKALRRMAGKVRLDLLSLVGQSDLLGRGTSEETKKENRADMALFRAAAFETGVEKSAPKPLLMGRHLMDMGMKPGVFMGEVLKATFEAQLDGQVTTLESALEFASQVRQFAEDTSAAHGETR